MARLTIDKRNYIIKTESKKKFYDKIAAANKSFNESVEKEIKKSVPAWTFNNNVDPSYLTTSSSCTIKDIKDKRNKRWRSSIQDSWDYSIDSYYPVAVHSRHKFDVTKTLQNKIDKINKLKDDQDSFDKKLRSVINGFTTTKKLVEALPELKEYFKDDFSSKAIVPTAQIKEVRSLLVS